MKECYENFKGARTLVVLALALAAALATVSIAEGTEALSEYDVFSVDGITYEVENVDMKHVYIDHYQGNPTHIFGTVSYDGSIWTVDSMISNAFMNCKSLISVDLSGASNVTYSAFRGCSNLKEVNLPKAGYIGDYAFQGCNALTHIKFSESLLNVGDEAFSVSFYSEGKSLAADAGSLLGKEFVGSGDGDLHEGFAADSPDGGGKILYGVTDYASHSVGIVGFEGGPAQISGTVSYGGFDWTVVSVGDNALKGCTCMKFVDLPEAVSIGNGAFSGCPSLRNVRFSSSLAIVGTDAFQMKFLSEGDAIASDADHLRGKEFVGYGSFLHEGFIVASPDGEGDILLRISAAKSKYVDIVGFEGNPSQVSGTVSYGGSSWTIMFVSNDAFYGCQSLETADLPNATELGINAFNGCTSLKEINIPHTTYISDDTFNGCTSLRYMDLQSVVDLNENAFYDCLALSHIRFSDKLDNVGMDVFSVDFYSEGELLAADAGSLLGKEFVGSGNGDLHEGFAADSPDGGGKILYGVMDYASHSVGIVGFEGGPAQISGTVSHGDSEWKVVYVGDNAFDGCGSLATVDLPSAASVGDNAFEGCRSLKTADLPSATTVGASAFFDCRSLKTADLPSATSVGDHAFQDCRSLTTVDLPSATSVGEGAFYGCGALAYVGFSDALESVGDEAFTVSFYSGSEKLAADAASLKGKTFTGDGDGKLYESFEISWLDDSGALADTTLARKGETPSHDGLTKEPTDRYSYEFAGWSPEPGPAVKEASYTAVFDAAVRAYPVPVVASPSGYGKVSASEIPNVPYGTALPEDMSSVTIVVGGTEVAAMPAEADAYVYSFVRWEASGLVDGATGTDTALTAVFDRTPASDEKISVEVVVAKASGSSTSMSFRVPSGTVAVVDGTSLALGGIRLTNSVPQDDDRYAYSFSGWTMDGAPLPDGETAIAGGCLIASSIVATERSYEVTIAVEGSGAVSKGSVVAPYRAPVYAEGRVLHVGDVAVEATPAAPGEESMPVFLRWEVPSVQVTGPMTATAVFGERPLTFVVDSVVYRIVSEGEVTAVGFEGSPVSLSVPSSVEDGGESYAPTSIADSAFAGCATVTSVSIGGSVASIGDGALDSPHLRSVDVSSGNAAYSSIAGVLYDKDAGVLLKFPASKQRLVIPSTVTEIAAGAFQNAGAALKADHDSGPISYFRYVNIPASVTRIGEGAFAGSTLEVLKFEDRDGVEPTQVGSGAFSGCSSLDYVVFPGFMLSAEPDSFSGCVFHWEDGSTSDGYNIDMRSHKFTGRDSSSLEVYVPAAGGTFRTGDYSYRITESAGAKEVILIGFADSASRKDVTVFDEVRYLGFVWKVTSVGAKAFMGDATITSVNSMVDVGFKAFAKCPGLEYVMVDEGTAIGSYAFAGCRALKIVYGDGQFDIGESAFSGCSGLAHAFIGDARSIGKHAFYGCALKDVDLSSAASIGYGAFTGNDLQRVAFSDGLSDVDPKAFFGYSFKDPDGGSVAVSASTLAGKTFEGSGKVLSQTS